MLNSSAGDGNVGMRVTEPEWHCRNAHMHSHAHSLRTAGTWCEPASELTMEPRTWMLAKACGSDAAARLAFLFCGVRCGFAAGRGASSNNIRVATP